MDIIQYLLSVIQYLYQQNCWLITFICKYIPLKQWDFDDSHSPKYQKLKTDELPEMEIHHNDWDWQLLIPYYEFRRSNPSHAAKNVISLRTASVPAVMPLNLISTATTAGKARSNAISSTQTFHQMITVSPKSIHYAAHTVEMLWYIKMTENTLSSTNA